ncbi:MAG: 5-formyltetrahydrofolate cyclo-ligase [Actinomycetota bacterium]|nr:5-formyltetrahydrofolate cyclo-ligase [Actinomycetota bacterium]
MDKQDVRGRVRALGPVDPGQSLLVVSGLFSWMSGRLPGTASAFLPLADEVDLTPLFERLPGWRWVLPRVEEDGNLTFRDRDLPLERHAYGMDQPVDSGQPIPVREIDVLLVPGIAFDMTGARLGRGGGFYDRVLEDRRGDAVAIGVSTSDRVFDRVPALPHDQPVQWLATEAGVGECG